MCGISGFLNFDQRPAQQKIADAMNARLVHRGPDGGDTYVAGPVALAHRRLAIIDPATGRQPLSNEDQSIWLVANGEIYNYRELRADLIARGHRFRTNGDCETIVHGYEEWGVDVLQRLRGMFAFALWDGPRRQLLLARDRVGIKPLCYALDRRGIAFASEIQALKVWPEVDRSVDLEALDNYLHLQYIPAPRSIYRGIRKLEPGHRMTVGADGHVDSPARYWRLQWNPQTDRSEAQWLDALDGALQDAVQSHLVADVPFGAFLSGGVDSSTVVAYAARELDQPLRTFTIGFDQPEFDEREPARRFAEIAGTRHQEQVVGLDALALIPRLVHHYGEPFADSSAVCTWRVCEAARREVTMVLSGDGGDEVFAGYSYFPKLVDAYPAVRGNARRLRRMAGDLLRKTGLLAAAPDLATAWYDRSPWFGEASRQKLWRAEHRSLTSATRNWNRVQFADANPGDVLSRSQRVDFETYLPNDNLAKVDIASMAHGLEVRVPLLDHRLLEMVATMPAEMRLRQLGAADGTTSWCGKYALKRAASRFYPWGSLTASKRGFSVPVAAWFATPHKAFVRDCVLDEAVGLGEWFDLDVVRTLIDEHGELADHGHRLWSLVMLASWRRAELA
jgi:asparagine synthase (glutamine-hydrolysing)